MRNLGPIVLHESGSDDTSLLFGVPWDPDDDQRFLRNVTVPTVTPVLPDADAATGTAVVIAPGGALHFLSVDNEGIWVAEGLAERGIAAFVLHYRVEPTPVEEADFGPVLGRAFSDPGYLEQVYRARRASALEDGGAAIRLVRRDAATWGLSPDRVGMLGFSAGGYVSLLTTLEASEQERPSFLGLLYSSFPGAPAAPVPAPPMFLAWATDDGLGDRIVSSSLDLYTAWREAGAAVEAHAYASGGHGFGIRPQGAPSDAWFDAFVTWLEASGF